MFLKTIFIQAIILHFNFTRLFCFPNDPYINYRKNFIGIPLNPRNTYEFEVCSFDIGKWANLCNRTFIYLRNTYEKYENKLYLNYKAFKIITNNKCRSVKVKVPLKYGFNQETVDQIIMHCYARGSIDEFPNMKPAEHQFYNKIVIYPSFKDVMIFEQTENPDEYKLLDWNTQIRWTHITSFDAKIFEIPIPVRMEVPITVPITYDSFNFSNKHILLKGKQTRLQRACSLIYGRLPYSDNFILDQNLENFVSSYQNHEVLFPGGQKITGPIYTCPGFIKDSKSKEKEDSADKGFTEAEARKRKRKEKEDFVAKTYKYKLMLGRAAHETIAVINVDNKNYFQPIELIQNLTKEYIKLMFAPYELTRNLP